MFIKHYFTDIVLYNHNIFLLYNNNLTINSLKKSKKYLENYRIKLFFNIKDFIHKKEIFFYKKILLNGVGYRFILLKNNSNILKLLLGYSHAFYVKVPSEININIINYNNIYLSSKNYLKLNIVSNTIKSIRYPDPYKGKGVSFEYDFIKLKEGKKIQ